MQAVGPTIIGLLVLGAGVGIHFERRDELSSSQAQELKLELARAISGRVDREVVVDADESRCTPVHQCTYAIRERTGASDVVLLKAYRGPTKIHLVLRVFSSRHREPKTVETDVPKSSSGWGPMLERLVEEVEPLIRPEPLGLSPSTPQSPRIVEPFVAPSGGGADPMLLPYLLVSTGVLVAGIGVGFGISSRSAFDDLRPGDLASSMIRDRIGQARSGALAANVLYVIATAAVSVGLVLFAFD